MGMPALSGELLILISMEIWKDVIEYEGLYQVSNLGQVKSLDRLANHAKGGLRIFKGKILKSRIDSLGKYTRVSLSKFGKTKDFLVHRLVGQMFIPNPFNKEEINHINGVGKDNKSSNLEWVTRSENIQHSFNIGIRKPTILTREQCALTKLNSEDLKRVISFYLQGVSIKKLSVDYNMSESGLSKTIKKELKNGKR